MLRLIALLLLLAAPNTPAQTMSHSVGSSCTLKELMRAWQRPPASFPTFTGIVDTDVRAQVEQPYRVVLNACVRDGCKPNSFEGAFPVEIRTPGRYRIAIDQPAWIDVIGDSGKIEGLLCEHPGCNPIRKIVQFELPAGRHWLHLSAAFQAEVGFLVAPAID